MHDRYARCAYEVDKITATNRKMYISKTVWIQIWISVFICKFVLLYVGLRGRRKMSVNIETNMRTINLQERMRTWKYHLQVTWYIAVSGLNLPFMFYNRFINCRPSFHHLVVWTLQQAYAYASLSLYTTHFKCSTTQTATSKSPRELQEAIHCLINRYLCKK